MGTLSHYLVEPAAEYNDHAYNERFEPFTWTKTADQILAKAYRQGTSDTRH